MLRKLFYLILLLPFYLHSQHHVSGKIDSDQNYTWILLYKIDNGKPIYLKNGEVKNNEFKIELNEEQIPGIYRLYYHLEQDLFIEFLYNKEDIALRFKPESPLNTLVFAASKENTLYQEFYTQTAQQQNVLDSLQVQVFKTPSLKTKLDPIYKDHFKQINRIQQAYLEESKGMLAQHLIKVDQSVLPQELISDPEQYLNFIKSRFYQSIDFQDPILINSTYLSDKIIDYIFYLNQSRDPEALRQMHQQSIDLSLEKIKGHEKFKKNIIEQIIDEYITLQDGDMVAYMIDHYYKQLPTQLYDEAYVKDALIQIKTSIGQQAPDITWTQNGEEKSLYNLHDTDYYTVVFFSSTCDHCREEIPKLYNFIKDSKNMKVIAIGLEDTQKSWEEMVKDMPNFTHILDLNKWESSRVTDYGIYGIPSYFVLDKDKNIIAKPEDFESYKRLFQSSE